MMQKIFCLPKISIKDLQSKVRQQRTTHKKYNYEEINTETQQNHNHRDIKITSPFYERSHHKEKCQCQYHRLKRAMEADRIMNRKKQQTINQSASKKVLERKESNEKEIAVELTNRISNIKLVSPIKLLEPLQNTLPVKIESINQHCENNYNTIPSHSISSKKLPTRKTFKSLKYKPILQVLDEVANSRIDALNHEYILLISQRLQNQKFKQKYLKTLFGFMKMKSNQNRLYMYNSKAYIQNSLNMLLNHFTMDKLLDFQKLSEDQINQIAYYMNCFPEKVKDILYNLGRAVSEMERTLSQMKKRRKIDNNKENQSKTYINNDEDLERMNEQANKSEDAYDSFDPMNYKNLQTKDSYISEVDQNNTSIINIGPNLQFNNNSNQLESLVLKNSHRQKYSILRSSSRKLNDLISNNTSKKELSQNKSIIPNQQPNIRKSIRMSQKNQQTLNRSIRSTVLGIVDEIQKETHFTKKKHTTKLKKTQLKSKYNQFDQKYVGIEYEKYLTKKNFQNLISQVERLDQNDVQRAQKLFKEFNVDSFLDDHDRIQEIVKTFKPLFNEKSLHYFLRQIVLVRDKRYIEKLERQLDDMLHEIKKNDPRGQCMDFFEIKPEKRVPSYMNKMVKCHEFKVEKEEPINHIKYFEAQEQIQRHKTKQKSIKMHLQQIQLRGIHFDAIDPSKSLMINHSQSPKRQFNGSRVTNLPDISDQKKILRYMKQNHENTFNYLANQFGTLCQSLSKQSIS